MAEKIINEIINAEKSAKEIVENRRQLSLAELEEAKTSAKRSIQALKSARRNLIKDAATKADNDAKSEIDTIKHEYETKINGLKEVARANQAKAVKFIIDNI